MQKRIFFVPAMYLMFAIMFSACTPEETLFSGSGFVPEDTGIYEIDSSQVYGYCDFVLHANEQGCWDQKLDVYLDCHYNLLFTRYGNGWTGSDATYSTPLPDGRIVWMFGDTFLGKVNADRSRSGAPFLRNTFMIQDGDEFVTMYQRVNGKAEALLQPENEEQWYWPLDATVHGDEFQMMLARMGSIGASGMWDFGYKGFDLAVFSLPDMELQSIQVLFDQPDISFGACLMEEEDYTYIYGISQRGFSKFGHVARVAGGDLRGDWSFYNGESWQDSPGDHIIANEVVDQFSVFKDGSSYYLVSQENFLGPRIFIRESDSPVGPWSNKRTLYCTPETGGNLFTYNAFVHPELSEQGELRISYNINSLDFSDLFENADHYRPKFIRIDNWK